MDADIFADFTPPDPIELMIDYGSEQAALVAINDLAIDDVRRDGFERGVIAVRNYLLFDLRDERAAELVQTYMDERGIATGKLRR